MRNAFGLSGCTTTKSALVFIVPGLGIAALFAALLLATRWNPDYTMVVLLVALVWPGDRQSTNACKRHQGEMAKEGFRPTGIPFVNRALASGRRGDQ